ncbi:hypothetical protein SETIT_6G183700v2 [Setaria italica]|uniref:Uncharacterized protein n=1 Tax=Setaria italica TaxID=4555 RepID=A0A368RPJ3_SETIT|nr:hypothetical protein SETIT_6G183700v2 [Setaria italica]
MCIDRGEGERGARLVASWRVKALLSGHPLNLIFSPLVLRVRLSLKLVSSMRERPSATFVRRQPSCEGVAVRESSLLHRSSRTEISRHNFESGYWPPCPLPPEAVRGRYDARWAPCPGAAQGQRAAALQARFRPLRVRPYDRRPHLLPFARTSVGMTSMAPSTRTLVAAAGTSSPGFDGSDSTKLKQGLDGAGVSNTWEESRA